MEKKDEKRRRNNFDLLFEWLVKISYLFYFKNTMVGLSLSLSQQCPLLLLIKAYADVFFFFFPRFLCMHIRIKPPFIPVQIVSGFAAVYTS